MSYASSRAWSDRYIPAIRRIVGPHLLVPSSFEVDTKQATDLVVLRARDLSIACRIRRHEYEQQYPYEFTIRSQLDGGARTELQKFVDGWGDWMFYGYAAEGDCFDICRWWILDLHAWRAALIRSRPACKKKSNGDGTHFVAFDVRDFPVETGEKQLVVAASHTFFPVPASTQLSFGAMS